MASPARSQPLTLGALEDRSFGAVIFDLDGTLIDSTPAVIRSWTTWAQEFDVPAAALHGWHGVPSAAVVRAVLPPERQADAIRRITDLELADVTDIVVLPGAGEALRALMTARVAIATSCDRPLAAARIGAAGLVPPTVLVTVDDVARGKPHPDPFLRAAELLEVPPEECLVVEDAVKGLQAARAAGCSTLAVTTTTPREQLQADAVVETLADLTWTVEHGEVHASST